MCANSHMTVMVRLEKEPPCPVAGPHSPCKLRGVSNDGSDLITCVAECHCDGKDCKHVTIYIPKKHEDWELCDVHIE